MSEQEILIRNFNYETNQYEFGRQEIKKVSPEKLDEIIKKIPIANEKVPVQIEIVTNDFIFQKDEKGEKLYKYNRKNMIYPNLKLKKKTDGFEIKNLKLSRKESLFNVISSLTYFIIIWILLVSFLFLNIIIISLLTLVNVGILSFFIFLGWAIVFPSVGMIFAIREVLYIAYQQPLITIKIRNPIDNIFIPNSLLNAFIYLWQYLYLFIIICYIYIEKIEST